MGGGIFHLMLNDFTNHYSASIYPNITIQNCEFYNFHHEMSSLIVLPVDPINSQSSSFFGYQKHRYSVSMIGNIFSGFTNCGSLLSNDLDIDISSPFLNQGNYYFSDPDYLNHLSSYQTMNQEYYTERYGLWLKNQEIYYIDDINVQNEPVLDNTLNEGRLLQQEGRGNFGSFMSKNWEDDENLEGSPDTMDYFHQFFLQNNTFEKFNMLKSKLTDSILERMEVSVAKVNKKRVAEIGLIIDIEDALNSCASIKLFDNRFLDIKQDYGYIDESGMCEQCALILSTAADFLQMNVMSLSTYQDQYYQITHIVKVRSIIKSKIVIAGNTFSNISITGPPILLHEQYQSAFNKFIILKNTFRFIHGYINSNVIQIFREFEESPEIGQLFEDPDLQQDLILNDFQYYEQQYLLMRSFMGGNILISENNFSEIAGCPTVSAGVIMLSVSISGLNEYANALRISSEEREGMILYLDQPWYRYVEDVLSVWFSQKYQSELVKNIEIGAGYGTVKLYRQNAVLKGNVYTNISMGVNRNLSFNAQYEIKGALIKIVNIMSTRISNETFENIGAYTLEHSKDILSKIFNQPLTFYSDNEKTELYGEVNRQSWINKFDLDTIDFMTKHLSTSLIATHQTYSFMLGPSNSFNNIWLVDKYQALSRSQQLGILLHMNYHTGVLQLGHESGETKIMNIIGMINPFTMERFPYWHPNDFKQEEIILVADGVMINGASSIVFNIHNSLNQFTEVNIFNINLDRIYHKPLRSYEDLVKIPSIISTVLDSGAFTSSISKVTIKDITLSNSQFEHSSGYFDLQAEELQISGFRGYNIGSWRMFNDSEWKRWSEYTTEIIILATPASIFKLRMFAIDDKVQQTYAVTEVKITDLYFSAIDIYNGALPLFEVDIVKDSRMEVYALLKLDNITLEDSYSSNNEDTSKFIFRNNHLRQNTYKHSPQGRQLRGSQPLY
ncbi:hypothetical protein FGO68_gene290 [Halteria grandinella]|uniref:Uncharacterized protein n=1 Tax=Halteria grandinella TaxID=5974 RepID=A0A8J8NH71_HALGN|nr:hypothetical protein FGO68_gene290 [Halteria grandinella]